MPPRALLEDDGYGVGIFYRREAMPIAARPRTARTLAEIEAQFVLTPEASHDLAK